MDGAESAVYDCLVSIELCLASTVLRYWLSHKQNGQFAYLPLIIRHCQRRSPLWFLNRDVSTLGLAPILSDGGVL